MSKGHLLNGAGVAQSRAPHPKALEAPDTCGSCKFCKPGDANQGNCFGGPPTPVVLGMGQNLAGQQGLNIQSLYPMVAYANPSCSVYKPRASLIIGAAEGAA